jgi:hypothetical protein
VKFKEIKEKIWMRRKKLKMALSAEPIATHVAPLERSYRDELNAIKYGGILTSKKATHTARA